MRRLALGPLTERSFLIFLLARTISMFGTALAPLALAFAVIELTGSTTDLGLVLAATVGPQVVFLLVGGILADRFPRHRVLVAANGASAAAQAATGLVLLTGNAEIWHLAALGAVRGVASAFFFPAAAGAVPQTVSAERLQEANALLRLSMNGALIAGGAAGGVVVAAIGPAWAIIADAATYLAGAALAASLSLPAPEKRSRRNFVRDLAEGWNEFRSRRWVWSIIVQFAFINAFATGAFLVLGPFIADRALGGAAAWGAVVGAQSAGMAIAALLALRIRPHRPLLVATSAVLLFAAPLALLALQAPLAAVAAAAFIGGVGMEMFSILWDTSLQQHIPPDRLSRISSYDFLGSFALIPVGTALIGPIAAVAGITTTLAGAAALVVLATLAVLAVSDVRNLRSAPSEGLEPSEEAEPVADDRSGSQPKSDHAAS
jgi:MFS family permease